jgi:hypothetical protein
MNPMKNTLIAALTFAGAFAADGMAQVVISNNYNQDFSSLFTEQMPAGWTVRGSATATSLGSTTIVTSAVPWNTGNTGFRHFASHEALPSSATSAEQAAEQDRVLGIRQSSSSTPTLNPGASFNFHFSTIDTEIDSITLDLQAAANTGNNTIWTIQYGLGASPTSWVTLETINSSTLSSVENTTYTYDSFGIALDDQSDVVFRMVALSSNGLGRFVGIDNFSITTTPIPEPSTGALAAAAGLVVTLYSRRKRKNG